MSAASPTTSLHAALIEQPSAEVVAAPATVTSATIAPAQTPESLINSCQGLVRSLAWKIHRNLPAHVELDDLIAYGQIGLAQAARDFDPSRGAQFVTYAYYRIRGAILDGLAEMAWFSRHDYHAGRYQRAANELLELEADESEVRGAGARENATWLQRVSGALSAAYVMTDDAARTAAMGTDSGVPMPVSTMIIRELYVKLEEAIDELPEDARSLIRGSYYEGTTLQEAGRRLGISKAWASRLHAKALERLGRSLRRAGVTA